MRKLASIAGAAFLALTAVVTPANAQAMSASGSCSPGGNAWGYTDINSSMVNKSGHNVVWMAYRVDYSGVPAPTTIGVIVRRNGELEDQVGTQAAVASASGGTFYGTLVANGTGATTIRENGVPVGFEGTNPDTEGFNTRDPLPSNTANPDNGYLDQGASRARPGRRDGPKAGGVGPTGGQSPSSGVFPGEYVFYVYTGSIGDVWNVKDGTVARNAFIADEKGFLGWFSCGVSTDQGSGPG